MTIEPGTPITLQHRGDGPHLIFVNLKLPHLLRGRNMNADNYGPFTAAKLIGAEFEGGVRQGHSVFETNVYGPRDEEVRHRDRPLLATFEFHHVQLSNAFGGRITYTGTLMHAQAHTSEELKDLEGEELEYLPETYAPLVPFFGWEAEIFVMPADYENR